MMNINKIVLVFTMLLFFVNIIAKPNMILYTKEGKQYVLEDESRTESKILLSTSFTYKNTSIPLASIDSIKVDDAIYKIIPFKNNMYVARLLFSGANEGYKIHYEGEKIIVIKNNSKEEYVPITKANKVGAYNYLFPDCFKNDSSLFKIKTAASDDNVIKEVTKKINCQNKTYIVRKKPIKIDVYIAPIAGLNLYKTNVSYEFDDKLFNHDKQKPNIGYSVGGKIGFIINNRLDIGVIATYSVGKAKLSATKTSEYYTIKDTTTSIGVVNNKSIDFDINFKYIILKSKLSPTISAGLYFSNKFKNDAVYKYTSDNGNTFVNAQQDLAARAVGFNISAGLNYKPISRMKLFVDIGYKIGVGLLGPVYYKISEGSFYTNLGIGIKINK